MIAAAFSLARDGDRSPRALLAELVRGERESSGVIEGDGFACTTRGGGARPRFASLEEATRATGPWAEVASIPGGLLVARGTAGGQSLYYARMSGAVVACSRLAPLIHLTRAPIDPEALAELVYTGVLPPGATPYTGLRRAEVATALEVTPTGGRRAPLDPPRLEEAKGAPEARAGALWEELVAAVRRAMEGHARVAVFVSGGLDSSAVLAAAVAVDRARVVPIRVAIEGPNDDRPHADALTRAVGVTLVDVLPADLAAHVVDALAIDARPYVLSSGPLDLGLLVAARAHGATIALAGTGGDELFGGDLRTHALELARAPFGALADAYRFLEPSRAPGRRHVVDYLARPLLKPLLPMRARERVARRALRYPRPFDAGPPPPSFERAVREVARGTPIPRDASARYAAYAFDPTLADVADWRAQVELASGVGRADVLFDDRIVRFVAETPPPVLRAGRLHRGLLRAALGGRVPDAVRLRMEKGILEPGLLAAAALRRAELAELATLRALSRRAARPPAADVGAALDRALATRDPYAWSPVWHILALEAWLRGVT